MRTLVLCNDATRLALLIAHALHAKAVRVCVGGSAAAASVLPPANAAKAGLSASLDSVGMEAALMSRPLPVLPPLLKPLPKQRPPPSVDAASASIRSTSGRLAGSVLQHQKLDHGPAGAPAAENVSMTPPSPKPGALSGRHGLQPHRPVEAAQADSAGLGTGSGPGAGLYPDSGLASSPASSGGPSSQPAAERTPVRSVMGTEALKLAARLAKLTGEAGIQLSSSGRVPTLKPVGDTGMQLPGTSRVAPLKASAGGSAAPRPTSASSAASRSAAGTLGRTGHR